MSKYMTQKESREIAQDTLELIANLRKERDQLRAGCEAIGPWMSAALDDQKVCVEMKRDIHTFFAAQTAQPASAN
jgi:hypothetical protein